MADGLPRIPPSDQRHCCIYTVNIQQSGTQLLYHRRPLVELASDCFKAVVSTTREERVLPSAWRPSLIFTLAPMITD